jgi:hypothetical protein
MLHHIIILSHHCRAVKLVHVADLMTGSTSETVSHLQAIVHDARLADAMVAIDG